MSITIRKTGSAEYGQYMKVLICGPSGSGKTLISSTAPNPLFASAEGGLMSIADRNINYADIKESAQLLAIKNTLDQEADVREQLLGFPVDTVVIDTIDEIQHILVQERLKETRQDSLQLKDWGWLGEQMGAIIRGFRNLDTHVIFTCLGGDTKVLTPDGVVPINKLVGQEVSVWARDGEWRTAKFDHYGQQEIFEVEFANGEVIEATGSHRWFATWNNGRPDKEVTTLELAGRTVRLNLPDKPVKNDDYQRGVAHGIVFGDGSRMANWDKSYVHLLGDDKGTLVPWVSPYSTTSTIAHPEGWTSEKGGSRFDYTYVGGLPWEWKDLPGDGESRSYWYGFIVGLLATDGTFAENVYITNDDRETLLAIAEKATWVGFHARRVYMARERSPYDGSYAPCFRLHFTKFSVDPDEAIRPFHQQGFVAPKRDRSNTTMKVRSVRSTGRVADVYCCVEPVTHSFTVGSGIPTGNCHLKETSDGDSGRVWNKPGLQGAIADQIANFMDLTVLLRANTITVVEDGKAVQKTVRVLQTSPDPMYPWIKDRSGKLPGEIDVNFTDDFDRIHALIFGAVREKVKSQAPVAASAVTEIPTNGNNGLRLDDAEPTVVPPEPVLETVPEPVCEPALVGAPPVQQAVAVETKHATPAEALPDVLDLKCSQCGTEITQDQADLSRIRFRTVACRPCSAELKKTK